MGITFVVIAKLNMAARTTALALSTEALIHERIKTIRHGHGRDTLGRMGHAGKASDRDSDLDELSPIQG